MNSQQISKLFNNPNKSSISHNQSNQQFNPIQTFGNRNSNSRYKINSKQKISSKRMQKQKYSKQQNQEGKNQDQNSYNSDSQQSFKEQTRIKLLSSFQQSYLGSISQPIFTQSDQPSDIRNNQRMSKLSYSQSKRSDIKLQKYLNTQPIDQVYEQQTQQHYIQYKNSNQIPKPVLSSSKKLTNSNQPPYPTSLIQYQKKTQQLGDKIKVLSLALEEQSYNLSIQQRLYEYLMMRIDQRGRKRKLRDNHQIVEKAIDFMDAGEEFMKEFKKLRKLQNL